jgi:hypothetical protein
VHAVELIRKVEAPRELHDGIHAPHEDGDEDWIAAADRRTDLRRHAIERGIDLGGGVYALGARAHVRDIRVEAHASSCKVGLSWRRAMRSAA